MEYIIIMYEYLIVNLSQNADFVTRKNPDVSRNSSLNVVFTSRQRPASGGPFTNMG